MMPSLNIGILTFHAQQNYGGVLQVLALRHGDLIAVNLEAARKAVGK